MLTITPTARLHLARLVRDLDGLPVYRLARSDGGMALFPDAPRLGDEVHEFQGAPVLVLDGSMAAVVNTRTLDVRLREGKPRLALL